MKTALFITSASEAQIVLTPETDLEKTIMDKMFPIASNPSMETFLGKKITMDVFKGSFYECRGGYVREGQSDDSIIIRLPGGV